MQPKARMTFRFEPPKPTEPKKPTRQPAEPAQKLSADEESHNEQGFISWNSPYQDDIHALEEIIRKSETVERVITPKFVETNAKKLEGHILAPYPRLKDVVALEEPSEDKRGIENTDLEYGGQSPGAGWLNRTSRMSDGPSWGRVFVSVTAAVATGALFGYMVLGLFTGEPLFPGKSGVGAGLPVQAPPGISTNPSTDRTVLPNTTVPSTPPGTPDSVTQVPGNIYYMLQYGVFKNEESMMTAVNQLQDKGLASATETSDGYRVYVGAAMTRDEAESLAKQLSSIEVYIKPVEGEPLEVSSAKLPEGVAEFMNKGAELTRMLTHFTGTGLQDIQPRQMDASDIASMKEMYRQWLNTVSVVNQFSDKTSEDGQTIVQALNSAVLTLTEFNRKPSRFHLWTAQSSVMKAVWADHHLRLDLQPIADG
jgi:hypothetical protein